MKLTILGIVAAGVIALALQSSPAQAPQTIKARGCLQGNGSNENPWALLVLFSHRRRASQRPELPGREATAVVRVERAEQDVVTGHVVTDVA